VVVVSSATPDHAEHIALCAERGRPMLCEKPIALTLAESSAAIRRGGPLLQVSFQRRFDPGSPKRDGSSPKARSDPSTASG
jgi:myo-inositol 2-dehydrogenase/D-chiro-inositol 1-dehydrogenase